jgi:hypothetical protein
MLTEENMTRYALLFLASMSMASALTVYTADFEDGLEPAGYLGVLSVGEVVSAAGAPSAAGLGKFFLRSDAAKNFTSDFFLQNLPAHTMMKVTFTFIAIDSWDGADAIAFSCCQPDYLRLRVDGIEYKEAFRNVGVSEALSTDPNVVNLNPGALQHYLFYPSWPDSFWRISFLVPHNNSTVELKFAATGDGWQAGFDESFGIDNLIVEVSGAVIPEPSTCALKTVGLAVLAGLARRRR